MTTATKADRDRWALFRHTGCIVTRLKFGVYNDYDVHHLVEGGRRLGHQYTIPLNPWYHRGVPPMDMSTDEAEAFYGPSLARNKRAFVAAFGTERKLLETVESMLYVIRTGDAAA